MAAHRRLHRRRTCLYGVALHNREPSVCHGELKDIRIARPYASAYQTFAARTPEGLRRREFDRRTWDVCVSLARVGMWSNHWWPRARSRENSNWVRIPLGSLTSRSENERRNA